MTLRIRPPSTAPKRISGRPGPSPPPAASSLPPVAASAAPGPGTLPSLAVMAKPIGASPAISTRSTPVTSPSGPGVPASVSMRSASPAIVTFCGVTWVITTSPAGKNQALFTLSRPAIGTLSTKRVPALAQVAVAASARGSAARPSAICRAIASSSAPSPTTSGSDSTADSGTHCSWLHTSQSTCTSIGKAVPAVSPAGTASSVSNMFRFS